MSPYERLPPRAFWRSGVAEQSLTGIADLYRKKFAITPAAKIAAAGSCFAQHISRHLRLHGYSVMDVEPPPPGLTSEMARRFGYTLYSARYGNIYVVRHLLQLLQEAYGHFEPGDWIWERQGRYFDALRPAVEPNGLDSPEEVKLHRKQHLARVRRLFDTAEVFVFTFGLTETWIHAPSGTVYPTAPGTVAGAFDSNLHLFKNFIFDEIYSDFMRVRQLLQSLRPDMRFILTVSPVPLTATASDQHVLSATLYSKSVLRAVAGQLEKEYADIDYFPSYELIASHFSRGRFFEANLRSVNEAGIQTAMDIFLREHGVESAALPGKDQNASDPLVMDADEEDDVVCEQRLLESFAR
jgi:hypothetical protein